MKKHIIFLFLVFISVLTYRCGNDQDRNIASKGPDILMANLDTTIDPCVDFFGYANGTWFKKNPIPSTESRWGIGNMVDEEINNKLKKLSEDAAAKSSGSEKGSSTQLIGDFYSSGMDSVRINKDGISPVNDWLSRINDLKDIRQVIAMIASLQEIGVGALFGMYAGQDEKNSEKMALILSQGGLGLPNRDYYYKNDDRTKKIREEYKKFMTKIFMLLGDGSKAEESMNSVFKLETSLAEASRTLVQLRDPYGNYNKMDVSALDKICPAVPWSDFFRSIGVEKIDSVIVRQPEFYKMADKLLKNANLDSWKNYLRWHFTATFAEKLGGEFDEADFDFNGRVLLGVSKQKPRWRRVMDDENDLIGEMLGQLFVKEFFSPVAKKRYEDMVGSVIASYEDHIKNLDWMSDATKSKALIKLHTIKKKVGYPDKWKDFSKMDISNGPYVLNCISANKWWWNYDISKIGKPVDRTEWDMTPQEYNAYYDPSNNEIVLPAAIFSIAGIKDEDADDAMVYGYGGASTIGHELTHGFDDEGRLYDEKGNLKSWWTEEDSIKFLQRTKLYVHQFDEYKVLDSLHVNGEATLGENIADLGGVVIALDAFKKTEQYKKGEKIGGLTPTQRFFLGYALGWLIQQQDKRLAKQILTDVHSPAKFRVNGPFSNVPEFYEAFGVKEGKPMWRADSIRVKIW